MVIPETRQFLLMWSSVITTWDTHLQKSFWWDFGRIGPHGDAFVLPRGIYTPPYLRGLLLVSLAGARFGLDRTVEGNPLGTFISYQCQWCNTWPLRSKDSKTKVQKGEKGFWKQFWVTGRSPPLEIRERMAVIRWKLALFFLRTLESECQLRENQNISKLVNQHQ